MLNFEFYNPARILFGKGMEEQVGKRMAALGRRVLLVYGGGSIKRSGLYDTVLARLADAGVEVTELAGVQPNPRLGLVREGIRLCRENRLDAVLAVGGGSVIDTAKTVALGACADGDVWDFFERLVPVEKALPVGVVLTIPAAGSESSDSCVITKEEGLLKRSCAGEALIPRFAILNPAFTCTLPPYQTACGATDILAHLMERYFTRVDHVDLTDRLLEATMRTVINYTPLALERPDDYHIRAELMWAGTVAHNNLLDTGRIGDWASHQIEHELSALYDIAHGAGLAIGMDEIRLSRGYVPIRAVCGPGVRRGPGFCGARTDRAAGDPPSGSLPAVHRDAGPARGGRHRRQPPFGDGGEMLRQRPSGTVPKAPYPGRPCHL